MPIVNNTHYKGGPMYLFNGHLETVVPSIFFKVKDQVYTERYRLELPDGDFLDIDWLKKSNKKCIVLSHGLEGDSHRYYMKRSARYFGSRGWDVCAWNCRSCSGEMNRLARFYHHGDTEDLDYVIQYVLSHGYTDVVLMGFSMGGSMLLKYLGESSRDERIKGGVAISAPCNLKDSSDQLSATKNRFYEQRFLKKLVKKMKLKASHNKAVDTQGIDEIKDFETFHERYTAPLHGFLSKADFFTSATCDRYMNGISVPVLVLNALNDPILGKLCYPVDLATSHDWIYLETPERGGHVGFTLSGKEDSYMEIRAEEFINETLNL